MYISVSDRLRKIARVLCADYADTQQFPYTNPGNEYPSDIGYDIWPGGFENNKENEPASKKDDESKKWDTVRLGPGPTQTDWVEKGEVPHWKVEQEPPKTDDQAKMRDFTKPRGDDNPDEQDRELWVGEGIIDPFSF
jgi:hypothetical protein